MVDPVKQFSDIQFDHPVIPPAAFPGYPSASIADFPGRYPYESAAKIGSTFGSKCIFTTICATRSATVGIPRILTPPLFFGISTAFTAAENSSLRTSGSRFCTGSLSGLFQISPIVSSSTPAAPLFAFTRLYASHTVCLGISYGFVLSMAPPTFQ